MTESLVMKAPYSAAFALPIVPWRGDGAMVPRGDNILSNTIFLLPTDPMSFYLLSKPKNLIVALQVLNRMNAIFTHETAEWNEDGELVIEGELLPHNLQPYIHLVGVRNPGTDERSAVENSLRELFAPWLKGGTLEVTPVPETYLSKAHFHLFMVLKPKDALPFHDPQSEDYCGPRVRGQGFKFNNPRIK